MNLFPEDMILNGQRMAVDELMLGQAPETVRGPELSAFLQEWYSRDPFLLVKTSGSTGPPKTIRLNKNFVAESARRTIRFFQLYKGQPVLHGLPLTYIAGKLMVVRALLGQLDLRLVDPSAGFSLLKKAHFRFAAMVPQQVVKILNAEPSPGKWLDHVEQLLIGGSAVPQSLENRLQSVSTDCYSGYAMTETATHIAVRKLNGSGADSWYHCLEDIRVRLSAEGCLQIFMPGVEKQPVQTTDLAEVKDEKTFRITGRIDHVIISGGIKYSPEQIERKLEPFIKAPFLISSLPHESLGEQLILAIEGKENEVLAERLRKIFSQRLGKFEKPRQVLFISKIPSTGQGKPDRLHLYKQIRQLP